MCGIAQTIQQSKKIPRASSARGLSSVVEAPCGVEQPLHQQNIKGLQ
jgi:hypothetical protein